MTSPSEIEVRPCRQEDADAVLALAPRLVEGVPPWRDAGRVRTAVNAWVVGSIDHGDSDEPVLVAVVDATVVGFVSARCRDHWTGDREAYVGELIVDRAYERRGVGRALMNAVVAWARQRGLSSVALDTGAANEQARAFYAHLGFREEAVRLTLSLR